MTVPSAPRDLSSPASVTRRRFFGIAATAIAGIGGIAVISATGSAHDGHGDGDSAGTPSATPSGTPAGTPVAEIATFTITAHDLRFEPKELRVPANTGVTLIFANEGVMPHDLVIPSLGINSGRLDGGTAVSIQINAPAGSHAFSCSVPGHKQAGMIGAIVAE